MSKGLRILELGSSPEGDVAQAENNTEEATDKCEGLEDLDESSPEGLEKLGSFFLDRYRLLNELEDLEKTTGYDSRALALTPEDHPDMARRLSNLGVDYGYRYRHLGQLEYLEQSIEHRSRALALTPKGHPDMPVRLADLAMSYNDRYRRLGRLEDLEKSIEHYSHAVASTPDDHPNMPDRLANLGVSCTYRFERLDQLEDLDRGIQHLSRAVALTPEGHPKMSARLANLGAPYGDRYQRLGRLEDLEKAIECDTHALALTPDGNQHMPLRHANLGASYTDRYRRLGHLEDLEKAIEHQSCALELTLDDHRDIPDRIDGLGASYSDRYYRLGQLDDLEKSLEHRSRALSLTPEGHPDIPHRLAELAVSYSDRFEHLGEVEDLEKSIEHRTRALSLTPEGHPNVPRLHAYLGASYSDRYRCLGQEEDLDKSIEQKSRSIALTPEGHPELPYRLGSLGVSYSHRYQLLSQLEDLEKATEYRSRALALTPEGHPSMPHRLTDLGVSYADRFKRLGNMEDLEGALQRYSRALELIPEDHPNLPQTYYYLALAHLYHFERTGDIAHSTQSLGSFRTASQLLTGAPRDRFKLALGWAMHASKHTSLNPIEAYQTTIDLLPQFIWLGATTRQRYQDLSTVENLAINAASVAIVSSDYSLALEWLEHARCVVWNQSLMLRSPLDQLHSFHPVLATQLQTVGNQLHSAGFDTEEMVESDLDSDTLEQAGQERRRLAAEYLSLLSKTRQLPSFEDFLRPMQANNLIRAARHGPIIVINCHQDRCDALFILPGQEQISHLPLPNFTEKKAQSARSEMVMSLRHKGIRERGVKHRQQPGFKDKMESMLASLWNDVVKPVLDYLGYTNDMRKYGLPHITWCPTGALSFLPLHAAGDYSQPEARVFNYVISSYTPTVTAILNPAPSTLNDGYRVLAIGQAHTPRHSPLPGIVEELACLKAHAAGTIAYSQLIDEQATTTAVLDAMEQYDWVHLACHAHQNVYDPTKSGFFLHDGTLDLASINRRSFKNKGLAFLSACQTATGDEILPDEAIHLASGILMAGYPSVIATMWSVSDKDAPFVADKVYAHLMGQGKVGNGEAGKALHYAVAELRDKIGEKEFGRWVPYIHIGS
ncbi:unnamed protein product [Rhizoctonia solani]|uniref:CHAT domain-containing protein n=1 Tax=Rhizoctonia solani TaxID=456999 RepID=A0A8H3HAB5_9AGAM|nr:unnamed protein product [Rhizoctonia solani]